MSNRAAASHFRTGNHACRRSERLRYHNEATTSLHGVQHDETKLLERSQITIDSDEHSPLLPMDDLCIPDFENAPLPSILPTLAPCPNLGWPERADE